MKYVVFPATMASAGTLTSEVDLGHAWSTVYLEIPTQTSNILHLIQAARESGGTYRRIYHPSVNDSTLPNNLAFSISSSTTQALVPIPGGFRYMKVETSGTVNDGAIYRFHCFGEW